MKFDTASMLFDWEKNLFNIVHNVILIETLLVDDRDPLWVTKKMTKVPQKRLSNSKVQKPISLF